MSDERGPLSGVDTEFSVEGEVIDLSRNDGPELTTDVDDVDPGSAGGPPEDPGDQPSD